MPSDLSRPGGWQGPTAGEIWDQRPGILPQERDEFLAEVTRNRASVSLQLGFTAEEPLVHYPQAAVDRRAVRDALLAQGLLEIQPFAARAAPNADLPAIRKPACAAGTESLAEAQPMPRSVWK